jgi:hypothetical protein
MNVWEALKSLRDLPDAKLRDRDEMRRVIAESGLNGEFAGDWPPELHKYLGVGMNIWQYPVQFADYLIFLSHFKIESYLEIGVRDGGTMVLTVEYLSRFNTFKEAIGVDIALNFPTVDEARRFNPVYSAVWCSSQTDKFKKFMECYHFDMVMVDGEHSVVGMNNDFDNAKAGGAKLITCHDICNAGMTDECVKGWGEIKRRHNRDFYFVEFVGQYKAMEGRPNCPNLGIGLAVRSDCYV